jgi:hypothetical protein
LTSSSYSTTAFVLLAPLACGTRASVAGQSSAR